MSQVIDDATSAMNATHDDASTLLDDDVPLDEFLDEQNAKVRQHDIVETKNLETPTRTSPPRYEFPKVPEGYVMSEETTRDISVGVNLFKSSLRYKERGITLTPAPRSHKAVLT